MHYFLIFLGGGLGALARGMIAGQLAIRWGEAFPWPTILVNVTGSFLIGIVAAIFEGGRFVDGENVRQFLMIGILGGYTTFSSFSLQTLILFREGQWLSAGGNIVLSVVLCLFGVGVGYSLGQLISRS